MSIIGFVPDPATAATVAAWVRALADKDEQTTFLCFETGFDGRTAEAVREALDEKSQGVPNLEAIDDPTPVAKVLDAVPSWPAAATRRFRRARRSATRTMSAAISTTER